MELFEQIRREYEFGVGTIAGVSRKLGVHRRMVREALRSAVPAERKPQERSLRKLASAAAMMDGFWSRTGRRRRSSDTRRGASGNGCAQSCRDSAGVSARCAVTFGGSGSSWGCADARCSCRRATNGAWKRRWTGIEAWAMLGGERIELQVFAMRSMASGAAYHRAYTHATQQAFLEAHELAFGYFGGVFRRLRYDNLKSAVKKMLRGYQREETSRFIAFRSHWRFQSEFCNPARGNEKGGVEGEGGYFRRNHWVPLPEARDLEELNA